MGLKSASGGGSKKGRQHVAHQKKCLKQKDRTRKNKEKAWKSHLENHPNDLKNREDIKKARA
jgi:hypothetical protein